MGRYFYCQGDLYVGWSTIVDAPTYWGTRDEVLAYALDEDREKPEYARPRIEAALSVAQSCYSNPNWDGWLAAARLTRPRVMYQQYGTLALERLAEWIATFDPETQTFAVKGFIEPFEDDPDREMPDRG